MVDSGPAKDGAGSTTVGQTEVTRIETAETNLTLRVDIAESNLTTRIDIAEANLEFLVLANFDGISANAAAIERLREALCEVIRLLNTPQGLRESECEACIDQPGFPYQWPRGKTIR